MLSKTKCFSNLVLFGMTLSLLACQKGTPLSVMQGRGVPAGPVVPQFDPFDPIESSDVSDPDVPVLGGLKTYPLLSAERVWVPCTDDLEPVWTPGTNFRWLQGAQTFEYVTSQQSDVIIQLNGIIWADGRVSTSLLLEVTLNGAIVARMEVIGLGTTYPTRISKSYDYSLTLPDFPEGVVLEMRFGLSFLSRPDSNCSEGAVMRNVEVGEIELNVYQ